MNEKGDEIELAERIKTRARELGFSLCGIAAADVPLDVEYPRYLEALARGLHGPLDYLATNVAVRERLDTDAILLGARSVVVVAARYDRPGEEEDPPLARKVARYARGRDYHNFLRKRVRALAAFIRTIAEGVEARPMSDTAPVLERAWAARAGVGFVGKNGLVIAPGLGSYFLLAEVVTTLGLATDEPIQERCGRCTLCLDACPTQAFVAPFVLDAGACISTTTIEQRGPIPVRLRVASSERLFGCDVCQDVCPHNAKERPAPPLAGRHVPHARWSTLGLADLARIGMPTGPRFEDVSEGTPLRRAGPEGLARNACLALANEPGSEPVLREIVEGHPSEIVREAAEWALSRLGCAR
ncbi:MAG: tRNA epoxyqueuosine(34) reductase QueG [Polyangiales bacterium]